MIPQLARSAQLSSRSLTRSFHTSRVARSGHDSNPVPFSYKNKGTFALKIAAFWITAFSTPFAAAAWQISKSSGGADA
jgi:cytochrome c oxidase subunit 7c